MHDLQKCRCCGLNTYRPRHGCKVCGCDIENWPSFHSVADHVEPIDTLGVLAEQEEDWADYRQFLMAQAAEEAANKSLALNALVYPEIGLDEMEWYVWA